jgi:hypothetical protein
MTNNDTTLKAICKAAFPEYKGRKFRLSPLRSPESTVNVCSYWDGGSRDYFAFVALADGLPASCEVPVQSAYDKPIEGADSVQLPKGIVCVRHSYFCGKDSGLTVICRPDDLNPTLLGEVK